MVDTRAKCGRAALVAGVASGVVGASVLVGWLFKLETLKRIVPGLVAMNPAAAVAFILAGVSLALFLQPPGNAQRTRVRLGAARLCALAVTLIGLAKLLGLLAGWDIRIDQWLFTSQLPGNLQLPNRMAPNAALNFFLLGSALLFVDVKERHIRLGTQFSAGVAGFGSLLAILGYAYGVQSFYRVDSSIPMALPTAIAFSLLITAFFLAHTDGGLPAIFAGDCAAGTMARRLLPAVVLIPAGFGWLELHGELAGIYQSGMGNAVFAVGNIVFFTILVSWIARALSLADLERKKSEAALQQRQTELRVLFDLMPAMIWFKDTQNGILRVNQRVADAVGLPVREIEGRPLTEIYPQEAARFYAEDLEIIHSRAPKLGLVEMVRGPGDKERWFQTDKVPVCDQNGKIIGIVVMVHDITKNKLVDDHLRSLAAIVEYSADAIIGKTLEGIITSWNPAAEKMFGYTAAEIIGRPLQVLVPPDRPHEEAEILAGIVRGELVRHIETVRIRKDGARFDVSVTISPIRDPAGKIVGASKIVRDITERKNTEEQLLQSQKLEIVGKLAGGIAHEFNSLLTAILGQSRQLVNALPSGSPLVQNVSEISAAAERAATLTRQLLAYGRKQILRPEILDLNRVLAGMESTLRHLTGRDVEARIVASAGLKLVRADARQIEQVVVNLAINAREAMPSGGKLTLETANISFSQESAEHSPELKPGDYVMLAITDTGTGMSSEVKARAFEPFFTTKAVGEGAGLGLSTCYGIIKQSGGHISVQSEPARGATFKIYLPQIELTALPLTPLSAPRGLPRGTERVLLAEVDAALREMAAALLTRLGYTVWAVATGAEALSLGQPGGIGHLDLMFADLGVPHVGDQELVDRARVVYPDARMLFTSAGTGNSLGQKGLLDQGVALLQRPFTPATLAHKLREVLDQPVSTRPGASRKTSVTA